MAEVWKTHSWVNRHFAEMLGFAEVNMYKTLSFFVKDKWASRSHNDFRRRIAWVFLTLGREIFPEDVVPDAGSSTSSHGLCWTPSLVGSASTLYAGPQVHTFKTFCKYKDETHTCGYCGNRTTKYCATCEELGHGVIAVCGRKSKRDCIGKHQKGTEVVHGSWRFPNPKKRPCST